MANKSGLYEYHPVFIMFTTLLIHVVPTTAASLPTCPTFVAELSATVAYYSCRQHTGIIPNLYPQVSISWIGIIITY